MDQWDVARPEGAEAYGPKEAEGGRGVFNPGRAVSSLIVWKNLKWMD